MSLTKIQQRDTYNDIFLDLSSIVSVIRIDDVSVNVGLSNGEIIKVSNQTSPAEFIENYSLLTIPLPTSPEPGTPT